MAKEIVPQTDFPCNDKSKESSLWNIWWNAMALLQPAFSHVRTFMWFAVVAAGLTIRTDMLGVSSIVRAFALQPRCYYALLGSFHSKAVHLDDLVVLWSQIVLRLFTAPLRVNGRVVLVGDGIKIAKRGKRMPGVKSLHQQGENKATFIMGHSLQAISVLVNAVQGVAAIPLITRIQEGVVFCNRHRKTLLDKMLILLGIVGGVGPCYFVGDAYYAAGKMVKGLLELDNHLLTRVRCNAVAYLPYIDNGPKKRGRPRMYGRKITVASLLKDKKRRKSAASPVYGEKDVTLHYVVRDLLWRPAKRLVRFVAVDHPIRGSLLLMCTDTSMEAIDIIRLYGLRFKIELGFKQAVHQIGSFSYHFWMKAMTELHRGDGNQYLHRKTEKYREAVKRKLHAYHVFLQAGVVAQGLLLYLSSTFPNSVWSSFGSWLRTIRPGVIPSEFVAATALRQSLPDFLVSYADHHVFAKFIAQRKVVEKSASLPIAA